MLKFGVAFWFKIDKNILPENYFNHAYQMHQV